MSELANGTAPGGEPVPAEPTRTGRLAGTAPTRVGEPTHATTRTRELANTRELARIEGLSISFPGRTEPAVDDVSLTIVAGECVALVGESGSGKTLTARTLLGLLPRTARVEGAVYLAGAPTPRRGSSAWNALRGTRVALVPQEALSGLDPLRRVEHEVGDPLRLHCLASGTERRERVVVALANVGMPEPTRQLRRRSDELSGGLRQRALVASALIAEPELIIADEPTTALDAGHRGRVLSEIRRRVDDGAGALLISHDLASVRGVADRVLVMRDGRIVEQGEPAHVLDAPTHPFTRELLAASPAGKPRGKRLLASVPEGLRASVLEAAASGDASALTPRLELRGIDVSFGRGTGAVQVLRGASFAVNPGETVGLVGESGSGKTTLLRVALGLHQPDAGDVQIDGVSREALSRTERRDLLRRIALVPQDPLDSFPRGASGAAILADALRAAGVPSKERRARAEQLAAEVGLIPAQLEQPAATLSGGQRQRVAIARALARDPELLLLDEPVSALDVTVQARVLDLLDEVQERRGTAYLFVSHDEDVIRHMSDRVLRLEAGQIR
ncbi:MAG: ABC transporter ATP-binding protein [Ancrocorticia sp.]